MVAISLILASVITLACAKPAARKLAVRDSRQSVPQGFVRHGAAPDSTSLKLRIALKSKDRNGLEKALYDVSTPSNAKYGQHLSKAEVEEFIAPSPETTDAVNEWLASNGLKASQISPAGDWISLNVDVQKANELLDADFTTFTHQATGKSTVRTMSYSLPAALKDHVNLVHPTTAFPVHSPAFPVVVSPIRTSKNLSADAAPASCAQEITPACLQAMYNIPTTPATQSSNTLGVSGFIDQHAQEDDLQAFLEEFRPDLSSSTGFRVQTLDGGNNNQGNGEQSVEANLDIQYTVGVATDVPTTFISVGSDNQDGVGGFLDIIDFLLQQDDPPQVLTTSYGFNEPDLPADIANNICDSYMQLGARGVSMLFSSGDGGVSGSKPQSCTDFIPTFPAGCPFITSVGATTGVNPERAATLSGGGFSNVFDAPDYQRNAVSAYLSALGNTNSGRFNPGGRAFPDIAAAGENVAIEFNGGLFGVAGTSCSSPIVASVIALLNDELAAAGKPPLGFLNPFIYSNGASALNDITSGNNPGCNTNGFPARSGWDPVTGLGTPNYPALRTAIGL